MVSCSDWYLPYTWFCYFFFLLSCYPRYNNDVVILVTFLCGGLNHRVVSIHPDVKYSTYKVPIDWNFNIFFFSPEWKTLLA